MSLSSTRWARATLAALLLLTPSARADDDKPEKPADAETPPDEKKAEDKEAKDTKEATPKRGSLVGRVSSELSVYSDTESVTVVTPAIGASLENPLSEWSIDARFLVDAVSAASVDIVATASRRWREVREGGSIAANYKIAPVGLGASGSFSNEPDYVGWAAGGTISVDMFQKNATLLAGYSYGHSTIGRSGTPFDVFSRTVQSHAVNGALTVLVNRDTVLAFVGDAIIELGDSSKPYRYVPMFSADVAPRIPVGATIDLVNAERLPERPLEQLPTSRYRFAGTVRLAHRFATSTLRVSERFYRDTWGLTASSTDVRYIFDLGSRVSLWPQARLHLQTPVSFWQRAYVANFTSAGQWSLPAIRTGDRELGPLRGLTGGAGIQVKVGPDASPADWALSLSGQAVWTAYLNDLYITNRVSGLGVFALEATFE